MVTKHNSPSFVNISFLSGDPFCLGNHLLDGGFLDEKKLSAALAKHKEEDIPLGECLVKEDTISGETLESVLAFQGKIREIVHDAGNTEKRIKLGKLLLATKMISLKRIKRSAKS